VTQLSTPFVDDATRRAKGHETLVRTRAVRVNLKSHVMRGIHK